MSVRVHVISVSVAGVVCVCLCVRFTKVCVHVCLIYVCGYAFLQHVYTHTNIDGVLEVFSSGVHIDDAEVSLIRQRVLVHCVAVRALACEGGGVRGRKVRVSMWCA